MVGFVLRALAMNGCQSIVESPKRKRPKILDTTEIDISKVHNITKLCILDLWLRRRVVKLINRHDTFSPDGRDALAAPFELA